jgi:Fe-S-cluster containining protein
MVVHNDAEIVIIARLECSHPESQTQVHSVMSKLLIVGADLDRPDTWIKYERTMCGSCVSTCCTMPVEVRFNDLLRIGLVQEFERAEPRKNIAKRLQKEGIVERYNQKQEIFTLVRMANNDCLYLDRKSRLCTIYELRPDTCRNHPKIGPRPGFCAFKPKP